MFTTHLEASHRTSSGLLSLAIHVSAVALLFTIASNRHVQQSARRAVDRFVPLIEPYLPHGITKPRGGGGGGGDRSLFAASLGRLPKLAPRQFTPPMALVNNPKPALIVEPTLVIQPDANLPVINLTQLGDPRGVPGPASNGRGSGGGIGEGKNGGVGSGTGPGYGPGEGGNTGGGISGRGQIGGVSAPAVLWQIEPEYSDEARRAKLQGTVVLYLEVDRDGKPRNIQVRQALGLGLDEKAMEAVARWKFRPGYQNGKPVATAALIEVNFRLL